MGISIFIFTVNLHYGVVCMEFLWPILITVLKTVLDNCQIYQMLLKVVSINRNGLYISCLLNSNVNLINSHNLVNFYANRNDLVIPIAVTH